MTIAEDVSEGSIEVTEPFTYGTLPPDQVTEARQAAQTIKQHARITAIDVLLIGDVLCHIKGLLGRGLFARWMLHEVGFCERTGLRYRRVHERLGEFADTVSALSPSELYSLSAAPIDVIAETVDKMRRGIAPHPEEWLVRGKIISTGDSKKSSKRKLVPLTTQGEKVNDADPQPLRLTEVETAAIDELAQLLLDCVGSELARMIGLLNAVGYTELSARINNHKERSADLSAPALLRLMSTGAKVHPFRGGGLLAPE